MKITKKQLKKIIKEEISIMQAHDSDHEKSEEVRMAVNQLQAIAAISMELSDLISEMNYVPEWGDGKISVTLDKLNSIRAYMLGKLIN